ncbi:MAG: uroporphyrinogen decarboxylase family protein, partial [Armatimonadia bacterium]
MTHRERLLAALSREPVDRPPVICPGGMMSAAVVEAMDHCGYAWPQAHVEAEAMAGLALAMYDLGALENLAVPFCMTIEADALGAQVNLGDRITQARVDQEPYQSALELLEQAHPPIAASRRAQTMLRALERVLRERPEAPVIGNLVGPVSLATSLVLPDVFLKQMFRQPQVTQEALERLTDLLLNFGAEQIAKGVEVIAIADPTATGEILGPRLFRTQAAPVLARLTQGLQALGARVIVHICGNVHAVGPLLGQIGADAISVDDMVSLRRLREQVPNAAVMGNFSAVRLEKDPPERIARWVQRIGLRRADIIAPACAMVPTTPLANLQALVRSAAVVSDPQGGAE